MSKTADLNDKLAAAHKNALVGSIFKHYKGGVYQVDGLVIDTDDGDVRVLYSRIDGPGFDYYEEMGIQFVRPIAEFMGRLEDDTVRFQRVQQVTTWVTIEDGEFTEICSDCDAS